MNTNHDGVPQEPGAAPRALADLYRQLYNAFCAEGFTEQQALTLVVAQLQTWAAHPPQG